MKSLLLGASALFCTVNLFAQTAIQMSDIKPNIGESFTLKYGNYVSPGSPGLNQTWDLSSISDDLDVTVNIAATSSPNADFTMRYVGASEMDVKMDNAYKITRMQTLTSPTTTMNMNSPMVLYGLPITYQAADGSNFGTNYSVQGIAVTRVGYVGHEVDGYGTLITPSGTFEDVYRIKITQNMVDSYNGVELISTIDMYSFIKAGYHHELAMVQTSSSSGQTNSNACYLSAVGSSPVSVSNVSVANVSLFPNPTTGAFNLTSSNEISSVTISDVNGRVVYQMDNAQSIEVAISTDGWERGVYFVNIQSASGSQLTKLVRE